MLSFNKEYNWFTKDKKAVLKANNMMTINRDLALKHG